jgi:iron complex outermembrane recepter protein
LGGAGSRSSETTLHHPTPAIGLRYNLFVMRLFILFAVFTCFTIAGNAQQTASGTVTNNRKEPLANASVLLYRSADSSLVQSQLTQTNGGFRFSLPDTGRFYVQAFATGHQQAMLPVSNSMIITLPIITQTNQLATVKAKKPMIEVTASKIIFNVEGSINAIGNTGFDLLRKSPGVMIDNNDNISYLGNGVAVYIDGKPSPLRGAELAAFLRSLQSADIESIELIKNPGAKYDAAGVGGIINIKLKKNKNYGLNGSVNTGYGIGIFSKYNGGFNLNYRNKQVNLFGNYSYSNRQDRSFMNLYREQGDSIFDQKSRNTSRNSGHNVKAGADFFLGKKSTLGILASVFTSQWNDRNLATTPILGRNNKILNRTLIADNRTAGEKADANFNINYRWADTSGREWNTDADYGYYFTEQDNRQPNQYFLPDGQTINEEKNYNIFSRRRISLFTFKSDYEQKLWGGRLGAGVKNSNVTTRNGFDFSNQVGSVFVIDNGRSNQFTLTENIFAAYINYKRQFKKWSVEGGLRAEQTNTRGQLSNANNIADRDVKRSYLNLFPSMGLSYQLNTKNSVNFNYSRRIDRPGYQSLNPFESKLDELTYQKGNPFLKPEYTNSYSITHSYKYTLNTSIGFVKTTDFSVPITDTIEGRRNFIQQRNAGVRTNVYINISYPFNVTKWWNVYANVSANSLTNKVNLGPGRISNLTVNSWGLYSQHTFTLPKKWTAELSGFYNSPSIWGGTFLNRAFWGVDAGVQKRFWNNNASVKLSVSDLFFSMQWRGISDFAGLYMDASGGWESRQLKLNFNYRFGNKQVKAQRNRKTANEDLKGRL